MEYLTDIKIIYLNDTGMVRYVRVCDVIYVGKYRNGEMCEGVSLPGQQGYALKKWGV